MHIFHDVIIENFTKEKSHEFNLKEEKLTKTPNDHDFSIKQQFFTDSVFFRLGYRIRLTFQVCIDVRQSIPACLQLPPPAPHAEYRMGAQLVKNKNRHNCIYFLDFFFLLLLFFHMEVCIIRHG